MNILLICPENFITKRHGGVSTYIINLAKFLKSNNQSVSVLVPGKKSLHQMSGFSVFSECLEDNQNNRFYKKINWIIRKIFNKIFPNLMWRIEWNLVVWNFIKKNKSNFDVVETPEWCNGILLTKILNKKQKVVTKLHRSTFIYKKDNKLKINLEDHLVDAFEMFATFISDGITSPNKFMLKTYSKIIQFYKKNIKIIKYGIHLNKSMNQKTKKTEAYQKYILFVGRIEKAKGCFNLIKAFEKINSSIDEIKLILIGEDTEMEINKKMKSYKSYLNTYIKKNNLKNRIKILPKLNKEALSQMYKNSIFVVVPSIGNENQPLVILESIAMNKAVIASKTGGIPEIIRHRKNGLLFNPGDSNDLAKKMLDLINNTVLRKKIEKNNEKLKIQYNVEINGLKTLNFYKEIIKK